jgi:hypothetical protein
MPNAAGLPYGSMCFVVELEQPQQKRHLGSSRDVQAAKTGGDVSSTASQKTPPVVTKPLCRPLQPERCDALQVGRGLIIGYVMPSKLDVASSLVSGLSNIPQRRITTHPQLGPPRSATCGPQVTDRGSLMGMYFCATWHGATSFAETNMNASRCSMIRRGRRITAAKPIE